MEGPVGARVRQRYRALTLMLRRGAYAVRAAMLCTVLSVYQRNRRPLLWGGRRTRLSMRIRKTPQRRVDDSKSETEAERQDDEAFQLAGTRGAWCLCLRLCLRSCLRLSSAPDWVRKLRSNLYLAASVAQGPVTRPGVALAALGQA